MEVLKTPRNSDTNTVPRLLKKAPARKTASISSIYILHPDAAFEFNDKYNNYKEALTFAIRNHQGVTEKTENNSIRARFSNASDAFHASIKMQRAFDDLNMKNLHTPALPAIYIHIEDVCAEDGPGFRHNIPNAGEICLSEATFNGLSEQDKKICRCRESAAQAQEVQDRVYTVLWNITEDEPEQRPRAIAQKKNPHGILKLVLLFLLPVALIFIFIQLKRIPELFSGDHVRSIADSASSPARGAKAD